MKWLPSTAKGVLIAAAAIALVYLIINTGNLVTIAVGAVTIAVLAYFLYVVGYRIHDALIHGF